MAMLRGSQVSNIIIVPVHQNGRYLTSLYCSCYIKAFLEHESAYEENLAFIPTYNHELSLSPDGLALTVSPMSANRPFRTALSRGVFQTSNDAYVEWEIETAHRTNSILFGIVSAAFTENSSPPPIHQSDQAWMYYCGTSRLYHAGGKADWVPDGGRPGRVERVGLLLRAGRLHAYANGERLSAGAMVGEGLPARARFAVAMLFQGDRVRRVRRAEWPADAT